MRVSIENDDKASNDDVDAFLDDDKNAVIALN
jgi:hypothetical protein